MRRAALAKAKEMEVQKTFFEAHIGSLRFVQKVSELPMVKAAVESAGDAYVKVKGSNAFVGKSIELAMTISSVVAGRITPIAEKGISVCSPISNKVDDIAANSLEKLITRVPAIKEEPMEIVQNTKFAIEKKITVINGYTEMALKTWPIQGAMNVYESILDTACHTLDTILPPRKEDNSTEQNGLASKQDYPTEEDKHKRGIWLAHKTYLMFSTAFRRVFGICQTQVENAASATDIVYKQVKNAVGEVSNSNNDASNNSSVNGDSSKPSSKKQGKNKKNYQEQ